MAADCIALMQHLGHSRFAVAGHDRGAYVAFRCALDHPEAIAKLAILEAIPIGDAFARCNAQFALEWCHWFFFAQPAPLAERAICADPDAWYKPSRDHKSAEAFDDYLAAIHNPQTVHAMMEDYRAGATIDREHDEADRAAGKRIACPSFIIWAKRDDLEQLYGDPLEPWRAWTHDVRGRAIDYGHHIAEEAPVELAAALEDFFA